MKVTLIYAGIGVAGFNPNRQPNDREGNWIGHGIASVGASARNAGYDVDLIDLRQLAGWEQFTQRIMSDPADVYGISVSAVDYHAALKTIVIIARKIPYAKIIVGGIHPTVFSEKYNFDVVDTVVSGEGEITFVKLLQDIEAGKSLPKQIRGEKPDLSCLPWVDRELFDYGKELDCWFTEDQETPSVTMLAGRGCPYKCTYCQPAENAVFGKPYWIRPVEDVIAELDMLRSKYDFQSVTFWDDTFTVNNSWIMEFCDYYEKNNFNATLVACSRADIICNNEPMVKRLSEIGLKCFVIGMESGSQRMLDFIKKGTTVEQNKKSAEICRKYGVKVFATYMYGLPTETNQEMLETANMIDEIKPDYPSPFWFTPIPGTEIYSYCEENDLILDITKERTIERTGKFVPTIKNIDYPFLCKIMEGQRVL